MFVVGITIAFLLLLNGILSQGVFDPYSFTEARCTGNYRWTSWFDTNDPNLTQGDLEMTSHIKHNYLLIMCS